MRAEDRFGWLDDEAAEDLLRGDAVDGTSSSRSTDAEELAKALEGLAVSHQPPERAKELPGEAAALAAFRASRSQKCRGAGLAPRSGRGGRMMRRTGTPLRAGLVMTLAGFALGGVAVAATNGMFPAPFGEGAPPAPDASDVRSPAAEPLESEAAAEGYPTGPEQDTFSRAPGDPSDPVESDGPRSSDEPDTRDVAGAARGNSDSNGSGWGGDDDGTDEPTTWPHDPPPDKGRGPSNPGSWPPVAEPEHPKVPDRVVVALCRAYEGDRIETGKRKQLERVAGGPDRVLRYCERHGDTGGGGGGTEGGDGIGIPEMPETPGIPGTPGPGGPSVPEDGEESSGGSGGTGGTGGSGGGAASGGSGGEGGSGGGTDGADGGADSAGAAGAPGASNGTGEGGAEPRPSAESAL